MDLLGSFRVLRRRWLLILVLTVVGAVIGAASTRLESDDKKSRTFYKATNTQYLDPSSGSGTFASAFTSLDQIAVLTTTGDVPDLVAKQLDNGQTGRQLAEHIVTTTNGIANTLEITASAETPGEASDLANDFAKQLNLNLTDRDQARYNAQRDALSRRIDALTTQVNQLALQIAANPNDGVARATFTSAQNELGSVLTDFSQLTSGGPPAVRLSDLERAQAIPIDSDEYDARLRLGQLGQNHLVVTNNSSQPTDAVLTTSTSSTFKGPVSRGLLGALLGLLAGVGLALIMERLDRRIRTRADAEAAYGLPVLAEIPRISNAEANAFNIVSYSNPISPAAEGFRAVRSSLVFQRIGLLGDVAAITPDDSDAALFEPEHPDPFVIMVTSAAPREGKTTTSANLAAVFAEAGSSVLLVNCDFRRPTLHKYFGIDDEPRRVHETKISGVKLVTNVVAELSPNPAQVVAAQRHVVAAAHGRFDVIILDTAPILSANDAIELVGSADLVLLVAKAEVSTSDDAGRALDVLTRLDAPLGGLVLTGTTEVQNDYYYSYANTSGASGSRRGRESTNGDAGAKSNGSRRSRRKSEPETGSELFEPPSTAPDR
ncbi:MAG TPA: division plane positioning ATPase MipZ [Acidimicrobiia bacterium]|jgi:Mrp family chromosome partitioning ATPase